MGVVLKYLFALIILFLIGTFLVKSIKSLVAAIRAFRDRKKSPKQASDEQPAGDVDADDRKGGASN